MIRARIGIPVCAVLLAACGSSAPTTTDPPPFTRVPVVTARPFMSMSADAMNAELTCPGHQWPPSGAPATLPGIEIRAIDREHIEIRNTTSTRYHVRVAGWDVVQLETCRGLVDYPATEGPLRPGETLKADLYVIAVPPHMPVAVSVFEGQCGEGECTGPPVAVLVVELSTRAPMATD